jgi:myo-inositol-1(or 4)-monophosphatase
MPDLDELLALATRLAGEAGALLLDGLGSAKVAATKSSPTDVVTAFDRAAERLLADGIRQARPDDAILGEEGTADTGTSGVRWIVDPLDGTVNYLYAHPTFGVSIAVEVDGEVEVGVVAVPGNGETYAAVRGRGAMCNERPLRCTDATRLATSLVGTGFSYDPGRRARQAEVLTTVLPAVRDVRRIGAAAVDLCWVAAGRLDAYYERGLQRWDFAAGVLIAEEAGAVVQDLDGGPASGDFCLASAPGVVDELRLLLLGSGAAQA